MKAFIEKFINREIVSNNPIFTSAEVNVENTILGHLTTASLNNEDFSIQCYDIKFHISENAELTEIYSALNYAKKSIMMLLYAMGGIISPDLDRIDDQIKIKGIMGYSTFNCIVEENKIFTIFRNNKGTVLKRMVVITDT